MPVSFAHQQGPLIIGVIRKETTKSALAEIRNGQFDGATAYDLHLSCLTEECRTPEAINKVVRFTEKPIMAISYNETYLKEPYYTPEEERTDLLLRAVEGGVSCVDIQAFTFDEEAHHHFDPTYATKDMAFAAANPHEISLRPEIIEKQMKWIDKVHSMGAEVLMSCHVGVNLNAEQAVTLAKEIEKRGPDVVKIVALANTPEEQIEAFRTIYELKKVMKVPFSFHCNGKYGKVTRLVCPMLGSYLMFCIDRFDVSYSMDQLDLRTTADAFRTLDWRQREDV